MLNLVLTYRSINIQSAPQLTLPVVIDQFGSYQYEGGSYGDVEFPSQPEDNAVVDRFLGITAGINSMTGEPLPKPSAVTVSVENGSGVPGQAGATALALGALGFHVTGTGNVTPVGPESETVVYYGSKAPAVVAAAQLVVHQFSGAAILGYNPSMVQDGAEVTVLTGPFFTVAAPMAQAAQKATTTTSTTVAGPTTTTTTSPTIDGGCSAHRPATTRRWLPGTRVPARQTVGRAADGS